MDVFVWEPMLDDALDTAYALFLRLEAAGYWGMLLPAIAPVPTPPWRKGNGIAFSSVLR